MYYTHTEAEETAAYLRQQLDEEIRISVSDVPDGEDGKNGYSYIALCIGRECVTTIHSEESFTAFQHFLSLIRVATLTRFAKEDSHV